MIFHVCSTQIISGTKSRSLLLLLLHCTLWTLLIDSETSVRDLLFSNMAPSATFIEFDAVKSKVSAPRLEDQESHDLVLRTFRVLIADLVQHFNGGHPGWVVIPIQVKVRVLLTICRGAMGMAAIGVALWKYQMRYSPANINWFNRDRFVLSNGMLSQSNTVVWNIWLTHCRPYMSIPVRFSTPHRL